MINKSKKILFIADEVPQSLNAGSIQFFRLFKDYPPKNLLVIGRQPKEDAEILKCEYHTLEMPLLDRIRLSRFMPFLTDLQSIGLALPKLPKKLRKIADDFNPDVVISLMQLLPFYYPAYHYAKEKQTPFILFCHDDVEDFAKPHRFFRKWLIKLNTKIYQSANKRICISPEMAKAWEDKYQAKGDYLYPTASEDIKGRDIKRAERLVNENHLTIGYAGSLAYGYREGINEIIPVLEKTGTKLKLFRNADDGIHKSSSIEFAGYAKTPEETWSRVVEECDVVILPYSEEEKFEKLYRTHFPSKLPEYIKLHMPVIINGPSYANGMIYGFSKKGLSTSQNLVELNKIIVTLKNSPEERINASEVYLKINDFDVIELFYQHLIELKS